MGRFFVRRRKNVASVRPALLILAFLVALHADVFVMGHTVLQLMQPSLTPAGAVAYEGFRTGRYTSIDPVGGFDAEYAWAAYFVTSVRSGSLPLWNPYQGLGQPQLANYVSAVLYPINWLTLVLPPAWWDLVYFLDWFLSAYFVYLLGRVLRLDRQSALVAAAAVFAAGFFAGFVGVRSIMGTVPWFPFLLYAIERSLQQPSWRWKTPALAAGTFCLATGGHPEPAFVGIVLVVLYLGLRLVAFGGPKRLREGGRLRVVVVEMLPAMLCGGLLAAPLWLPFAQYVLRDAAIAHATAGVRHGVMFFPRPSLALTVFPYVFGPLNDDIWYGRVSTVAWVPASLTFLALTGLIGLATRRRPGLAALAIVTMLCLAKLYGVPVINDVGRISFLRDFWFQYTNGFFAFGLCVFAGAGFAYLNREPPRRWLLPYTAWAVYVIAMLAVVALAMQKQTALLARDPWRIEFLLFTLTAGLFWCITFPTALLIVRARRPDVPGALRLVVVAGLLLQAAACFPNGSLHSFTIFNVAAAAAFVLIVVGSLAVPALSRRPVAIAAIAAACVVVLAVWNAPRLPGRANPLKSAPYVDWLAGRSNAPRIYALDSVLYPNFGAPFGLSSVTIVENLVTKTGAAYFSRFMDDGAHPARFFGTWGDRDRAAPEPLAAFWLRRPYWDLAGVRYLVTSGRDEVNTRVVFDAHTPGRAPGPVQLASPLESRVDCATGPFDAVGIVLSTYGKPEPGEVALDVIEAGRVTATVTADGAAVADNVERAFQLPAPACANAAREVTLRLRFRPDAPGAILVAWRYPDATPYAFLFKTLEGQPSGFGRLRRVFHDPLTAVQVWENPSAADRAFLAPIAQTVPDDESAFASLGTGQDLQRYVWIEGAACAGNPAHPAGASPGTLMSLQLSPNRVRIRYYARTAGILTLTDPFSAGWRATVNGRAAPVLKVDGAFRGVCLDGLGEHRVEFVYRPPFWNAALTLSAMGGIGAAALTMIARRRAIRAPAPERAPGGTLARGLPMHLP